MKNRCWLSIALAIIAILQIGCDQLERGTASQPPSGGGVAEEWTEWQQIEARLELAKERQDWTDYIESLNRIDVDRDGIQALRTLVAALDHSPWPAEAIDHSKGTPLDVLKRQKEWHYPEIEEDLWKLVLDKGDLQIALLLLQRVSSAAEDKIRTAQRLLDIGFDEDDAMVIIGSSVDEATNRKNQFIFSDTDILQVKELIQAWAHQNTLPESRKKEFDFYLWQLDQGLGGNNLLVEPATAAVSEQ